MHELFESEGVRRSSTESFGKMIDSANRLNKILPKTIQDDSPPSFSMHLAQHVFMKNEMASQAHVESVLRIMHADLCDRIKRSVAKTAILNRQQELLQLQLDHEKITRHELQGKLKDIMHIITHDFLQDPTMQVLHPTEGNPYHLDVSRVQTTCNDDVDDYNMDSVILHSEGSDVDGLALDEEDYNSDDSEKQPKKKRKQSNKSKSISSSSSSSSNMKKKSKTKGASKK